MLSFTPEALSWPQTKTMSLSPTASLKTDGPKDLTPQQLRYQKRKQAGLCCYGRCPKKTKVGSTFCHSHLQRMLRQVTEIYKRRAEQKLCFRCGSRPQFWGKRCVICRQLVARDPLPKGARTALRNFRELEAQSSREKNRETVRVAARKMIAERNLKGREEEALQLYFGLDDNGWRTHEQVAQLMHLTAERVRQLLLPSKAALTSLLREKGLWRTATHTRKRRASADLLLIGNTYSSCEHSKTQILQGKLATWTSAGLPNVILLGLAIFRCLECNKEECQIPKLQELHNMLATALLCKSDLLSGQEIRFLRRVAGMTVAEFAERLDVTSQTIQKWERLPALSFANEVATRVVLASVVLDENVSSRLFELPDMIRNGDPKSVIRAEWLERDGRWKLASY